MRKLALFFLLLPSLLLAAQNYQFPPPASTVPTTNASDLVTGTLPDGRFPAVLPALDGSALTGVAPGGAASGDFSGTYPGPKFGAVASENKLVNPAINYDNGTQTQGWTGVARGNGLFVAIPSTSSYFTTSLDGLTWTELNVGANKNYTDICFAPELPLFVATATNGATRILTSPDGTTWTSQTASAASQWNRVVWAPSISTFVAMAASSSPAIMTSSDGVTWTSQSAYAENTTWQDICWSPALSLFLAVRHTASPEIMTSSNGISWGTQELPNGAAYRSVAWSPTLNLFAIVGLNGLITTSPDGAAWTVRTQPTGNPDLIRIEWADTINRFVAVSSTSSAAQCIVSSADGITWSTYPANRQNGFSSLVWADDIGRMVVTGGLGYNKMLSFEGFETVATAKVFSPVGNFSEVYANAVAGNNGSGKTITLGNGNGDGNGGSFSYTAGNGGASADGGGGGYTWTGGVASSEGGTGGAFNWTAGNGTGVNGMGGSFTFTGGSGARGFGGGSFSVVAGSISRSTPGTNATAGDISLIAGSGQGTTGFPGNVIIRSGDSLSGETSPGSATIDSGNPNGNIGVSAIVQLGNLNATSVDIGRDGYFTNIYSSALQPAADNTRSIGQAATRWANVFGVAGTFDTLKDISGADRIALVAAADVEVNSTAGNLIARFNDEFTELRRGLLYLGGDAGQSGVLKLYHDGTASFTNLQAGAAAAGDTTYTLPVAYPPVDGYVLSSTMAGVTSWVTLGGTNASDLTSGTLPDGRFPAVLPVLDGSNLTNLNASNLASGTVGIAVGGTGATTANTGFNALAPTTTTGDTIYRTAGAVNARLAIGTTGNTLSVVGGLPAWTSLNLAGGSDFVTGALPINNGGTGQTTANPAFNALAPTTTTGDLIYRTAGAVNARLPIGTTGNSLTVVGGIPSWSAVNLAGGTNFVTGTLPASVGGTGAATLTSNNLLVGAGTGAVTFIAPGTSGNVLTSNGTVWASTTPTTVFGQNYQTAIGTALSTTTSNTFVTKVGLTTPALTGTYRVNWISVISNTGSLGEFRLFNVTDSAVIGTTFVYKTADAVTKESVTGFAEVVFAGVAKTFEVQYRSQIGLTTQNIENSRIEFWRVQ